MTAPTTLERYDMIRLRAAIRSRQRTMAEKCSDVATLLELYNSRANRRFVNARINSWLKNTRTKKDATDLINKLFDEKILAHREILREQRRAAKQVTQVKPAGAVKIGRDQNTGIEYYLDEAGKVLAPVKAEPAERKPIQFDRD